MSDCDSDSLPKLDLEKLHESIKIPDKSNLRNYGTTIINDLKRSAFATSPELQRYLDVALVVKM